MADQSAIRPISDDEYVAFRRVQQHAFNTGPSPAADLPRVRRQFERDRSRAACDPAPPAAAGPVGTAGVYSLRMTVPGAMLPVAGVTMVSVLPTHRRRGILRSLMRRQLADIAERGEEPIAALWASETPLYGRYGYGRASSHAFFRFGRGEGALHAAAPADPAITLRLAEPADAVAELAKVYETVLSGQPGFFARDADWWDRVLDDPEEERHGSSPLRCLLAEDGNGVRALPEHAPVGRGDVPARRHAQPVGAGRGRSGGGRRPLARPAQPGPDHRGDGRPAARRRPAAVSAAGLAPGPAATGRQPLGAHHRPAERACPARLRLFG
jgi:predicted N-acetyltransferase YhbS